MNQQFIQSLSIDWNKIEDDSYLREIEAINKLKEVVFEKPITFFVGENGSGKSTLLEALAVSYGFNPEGGTKNYSFSTFDSHSELYNAIRISKGFRKAKWGYFLRAESFYNVATKNWSIRIGLIHQRNTMKNHTERAFLRSHRITCDQMGYIYLMSRKQHYLLKDN